MQDHDPVGGNIKDYAVDGVLRKDSGAENLSNIKADEY
jgi:hypothetical protein